MKAIIFDMDGLMIDSETVTYHYYVEVLKEYQYDFNFDIYKKFLGKPKAQVVEILKQHYGNDFPLYETWDEIHRRFIKSMKKHVPLKKGLLELLEYLKNNHYKMIVASSSEKYRVETILDSANIRHYFDDIICGDEVKKRKTRS